MPRLLVAISAHGLGHLGQTAPVCNALHQARPDLQLILWSEIPHDVLRARIHAPFEHIAEACDLGLEMYDALHVDVAASWQRYAQREAHWDSELAAACQRVRAHAPDLILSDVGDMPLAAAQALGLPAIAMSSLNWADTARHYFHALPDARKVLDRLAQIQAQVPYAFRLTPGLPMHGQIETCLPPVGAISPYTRAELESFLPKAWLSRPRILIGMGGINNPLPLTHWSEQSALTFLVANQAALPEAGLPAQGIINANTLRTESQLNFPDLLALSDVVICKPGYGTFVEAALANTPVLYVSREDWPEQRVLIDWLSTHARCAELPAKALLTGSFQSAITDLLQRPPKPAINPDGAHVVAQAVLNVLAKTDSRSVSADTPSHARGAP